MSASQVFMTQGDAWEIASQAVTFGQTAGNHRYRMPTLPGEATVKNLKKGQRPHVPWGMQSATNLAGAISESFALGVWERRQNNVGIALRPDLFEKLRICVMRAQLAGVDFRKLKGTELAVQLDGIHEEARQASGANAAGVEGTNRHDAWEERAASGGLVGTPEINEQIEQLEAMLERNRLVRIRELSERVIRNVSLNCAGKFDDVLFHVPTGRFLMADLKTKRTPFFSLLEVEIQLAVYATAEWMLSHIGDDAEYVPGPVHHVDQQEALILHVPADGVEPMRLRRLDVQRGLRNARLARAVCDARSEGKAAETMSKSFWPDADLIDWRN